jgi:membrane protease YdiL (CAAX protease family)
MHLAIVPLTNVLLPGIREELGWRGFLQPRLIRSGFSLWFAMIITGAIWGLWHAPVMMRGQYPGHPYLGAFLTVPYCVLLAIIFGWLRIGSGSVWVAAVAHASLDISTSDGVAVLVPGFDFALSGGLESLMGWIPLVGFIAWLVWSGRLPLPRLQQEDALLVGENEKVT